MKVLKKIKKCVFEKKKKNEHKSQAHPLFPRFLNTQTSKDSTTYLLSEIGPTTKPELLTYRHSFTFCSY